MRDIGIVTFHTSEYSALGLKTSPNHQAYAIHHGYSYHLSVFDFATLRDHLGRPVAWQKVNEWVNHLSEHEWILWMDTDAIFVNFSERIESLIDDNFDCIIQADFNGINSGVVLLKNDHWTPMFLDDVYCCAKDVNHYWWEQKSMMDILATNEETRKHVKILPPGSGINEVFYTPQAFIMHCSGAGPKDPYIDEALKRVHG